MTKIMYAAACAAMLSACGGAGTEVVVDVSNAAPSVVAAETTETVSDELDIALSDASEGPDFGDLTLTENTDFAGILNNLRVSRGFDEVTYDARLDSAATKHAQDMVENDYFAHEGLDGSTVYDRIVAEGYDPRGWAENLAQGHQGEAEVLQAWVDSDGHNDNLNANLDEFALGVAGSGSELTWVLVLATEK